MTETTALGPAPADLVAHYLRDPRAGWSVGTFGAIGEFMRDEGEPVALGGDGRLRAVTARGGIAIRCDGPHGAIAYETPGRRADAWSHAFALCLPESDGAMARRTLVTELGPDGEALRAEDRDGVLFDIGIGAPHVDVCVRTADPEAVALLRKGAGRAIFAPDNPAMGAVLATSPHRVFVCRLGRLEVYQPIPASDATSPQGPHTHVLPKLLKHGRTHAATTPIPAGWVPCVTLHPASPVQDPRGDPTAFDEQAHEAFQALLARFGDDRLLAVKQAAIEAVRGSLGPDRLDLPRDRFARAAIRVALRQLSRTDGDSPLLQHWRAVHDR